MDEKLIAALVAGAISIVISAIAHIASERKLRHERATAARQMAQKFAEELLKHRLRLYPGAFLATADLGKGHADDESLPGKYQEALRQLRVWKTGEVEVVISEDAEDRYQDLVERLKKNPGRRTKYNKDQLENIWHARQRFRGSLRRDLGLMRNASRMRLQLPEDDAQ